MRVAPERPDLDAAILDLLVQLLHQLAPALLIECRDVEPYDRTVVARRESEIGGEDRLLDRLDQAAIPRLDDDLPRLRRADRGE